MNKAINSLLIFSLGAAAGVLATREYYRKHYEEISNEEIRSVKIAFARKSIEMSEKTGASKEPETEDEPEENTVSIDEYAQMMREHGYSDYGESAPGEPVGGGDRPYPISPVEAGEFDDYEVYTLFHYADGVLTDDNNEIIDDVDDAVGKDYAEHFGEYEDGAVYIRNNARHCDYEILQDLRNYYPDVAKTVPGHREV